jgi:hypothetical protein
MLGLLCSQRLTRLISLLLLLVLLLLLLLLLLQPTGWPLT